MFIKHFLTVNAVAFALVITATPVLAIEGTATPTTIRQEIQQDRKEIRGTSQENRSAAAKNRGDALATYCSNLQKQINNLILRINSRIQKQKGEGKDTSAAEASVAEATIGLASAKSLCDQAVAKFNSVPTDTWSVQHPVVKEARELAKQSREAFMKTRKALVSVIRTLVANGPKATEKPSATPAL